MNVYYLHWNLFCWYVETPTGMRYRRIGVDWLWEPGNASVLDLYRECVKGEFIPVPKSLFLLINGAEVP